MAHLYTRTRRSSEKDKDELGNFKNWLDKLSLQEMLHSMEFTFLPDNYSSGMLDTETGKLSFLKSKCHELEILEQMISSQSPPPTPIHPRVLQGMKLSSKCCVTDGKDNDERIYKNRFQNPRLFQLSERPSQGMTNSRSDLNDDTFPTNIPPEIAALLAAETSINGKKKKKHSTLKKKQQQQQQHSPKTDSEKKKKQYDVIARKAITACGQILSIGSTKEQQIADAQILLGTSIKYGCSTTRSANHQNIFPSCMFRWHSILEEEEEECHSNKRKKKSNSTNRMIKKEILQMMKIISRGKFLSSPPPIPNTTTNPHLDRFYSEWLNPELEWFSLSTYLASRFEIALWQTFYNTKKHIRHEQNNITYIEEMTKTLSRDNISNAIAQATKAVFLTNILQEDYMCGKFRDMMLWKIIHYKTIKNDWQTTTFHSASNLSESLLSVPIIEYSSTKDKLRIMILEELEECLSREAETQVLKSIEEQESKKDKKKNSINSKVKNVRRKKNKKKNVKYQSKNVSLPILDPIHEVNNSNFGKSSNTATMTDEMKLCQPLEVSSIPLTVTHSAPTEEKNRSTVMVLGIIEDVLHKSFQKLGFKDETDDGYKTKLTCHDSLTARKKTNDSIVPWQNKAETNKIIPLKSIKNNKPKREPKEPLSASILPNPHQRKNISVNQLTMRRSNVTNSFDNYRNVHGVVKKSIISTSLKNAEDTKFTSTSSSYQPMFSQIENIHNKQTDCHRSLFPFLHHQNSELEQSHYENQQDRDFFDRNSPIGLSLDFSSTFGWNKTQQQNRQKSLFADFFQKDEEKEKSNEQLIASSTAASIASSSTIVSSNDEFKDTNSTERVAFNELVNEDNSLPVGLAYDDEVSLLAYASGNEDNNKLGVVTSPVSDVAKASMSRSIDNCDIGVTSPDIPLQSNRSSKPASSCSMRSQTPIESPTNSPQQSPILVSLADLGDLRKRSLAEKLMSKKMGKTSDNEIVPKPFAGSLPSSPKSKVETKTITPSWSREDLRIPNIQVEKHSIKKIPNGSSLTTDSNLSYRNAALKNLTKAESTCSHEARVCETVESIASTNKKKTLESLKLSKEIIIDGHINSHININTCAQSDSALEAHEDSSHWNVIPRFAGQDDTDHDVTTRDGATTISSVPMPTDREELITLREERDQYKDMCLTLAAEVSKLKNLLAAEKGKAMNSFVPYPSQYLHSPYHHSSPYHPEFMPMLFHNIRTGSTRTVAAMSDLGINNDTPMSDADSTTDTNCKIWNNQTDYISRQRQAANGATQSCTTNALSDTASSEHATVAWSAVSLTTLRHQHNESFMFEHYQGMQSRLSKEVQRFMQNITLKLNKQQNTRATAIKRLTQLVTALWPRAQVKIYGSHVNNLCLPSSDLDFVVCLPAVHKNAPAEAPGVLEGRNAINESKQKLLARKLKLESWIDPRSIKIIERTMVPVIKVSTKDTRARVLQLDITFDAPDHHGLQAIVMVTNILEEFPLIRPIVLVLKQFLLDRGLLTAYSGGISSYGLFLMVARYLQEQSTSWVDCGSLLMGFLDFYGNSFDPRSTGISVARRQYFPRSSDVYFAANQNPHIWNSHQQQPLPVPQLLNEQHPIPTQPLVSDKELMRRHSFNDSARSVSSGGGGGSTITSSSTFHKKFAPKPSRFQFTRPTNQKNFMPQSQRVTHRQLDSNFAAGRPFSFDPLFIEDPISPLNNVGRNSFRIFQLKRAFSDAHRALVASLEWDMNCTESFSNREDYPLLKCLLQSEDVFFLDIDDHK